MSFYITLPSNASLDLYPKNTLTNYTTQLPVPLKFDVPYEVALVEMVFRQSWTIDLGIIEYKEKNDACKIKIIANDGESLKNIIHEINSELDTYAVKKFRENNKLSEKLEEDLFNYKVSNSFPKIIFKNGLLSFQCPEKFSFFTFDGPIKHFLGLNYDWYNSSTDAEKIKITNLHYIEALYIYCDIIDYQFTGDTKAPLLRTVVVSNRYNSLVSVNYETPHYVPVNQNHISTINIDIRSDSGNHIHFFDGKVLLKLHFRPIRYGL